MMKHYRICLGVLLLAAALSLCSCFGFGGGNGNLPPDDGSPWPEELTGTFVSGENLLAFNGDGQTVVLSLTEELADRMALPAGESEGTYVFLFDSGKWRYDFAEAVRFTVGENSVLCMTVPGSTDGEKGSFLLPDSGEQIWFEKEE